MNESTTKSQNTESLLLIGILTSQKMNKSFI